MTLTRNYYVVNGLRLFWTFTILWYELGIFFHSTRNCHWPDAALSGQGHPTITSRQDGIASHILLIADPQILDHRSYDRGALLTYLTRLIVDLNLRKNWWAAMRKNPDIVIFLGDMMDGGRFNMSDTEYEQYYRRFCRIFKLPPHIPAFFIPGNHDIGLRDSTWFSPHADARFISHFGPLNRFIQVANHTVILLDAPTLVEEDNKRILQGQSFETWSPVVGGPVEFVKATARGHGKGPLVLMSHIPLARENVVCGPFREKGTIRPGRGFGYENTLGKEATAFLLNQLKPSIIFSGDDHDYCEHLHPARTSDGTTSIPEISVKSFSMAMGIRRPGFQLLSLAHHGGTQFTQMQKTHANVPCLLPDQLAIYLSAYVRLLFFSFLMVLLSNAVFSYGPGAKLWRNSFPELGTNNHDARNTHRFNSHLPDPVSFVSRYQPYSRPLFCRFRQILFRMTRFSISSHPRKQRKSSYLEMCMVDIIDIAIFPLTLFFVISMWISI